jgi:hypothetical protein
LPEPEAPTTITRRWDWNGSNNIRTLPGRRVHGCDAGGSDNRCRRSTSATPQHLADRSEPSQDPLIASNPAPTERSRQPCRRVDNRGRPTSNWQPRQNPRYRGRLTAARGR